MSTTYSICCDHCHRYIHLATMSISGDKFGLTKEDESGRQEALDFITQHCGHNGVIGLRVLDDDVMPEHYHNLTQYGGKYDATKPYLDPPEPGPPNHA